MRAFVLLVLVGACFVVAPGKANAQQTTYYYRGNDFNSFSCGPNTGPGGGVIGCSTPIAGDTTYTTSDYVFATMTVSAPLAPNLNLSQIYWSGTTVGNAAGFLLTD
jgi:hypothetical protein